MKKYLQKGSAAIVALVIFAIFAVGIIGAVVYVAGKYNTAVSVENSIKSIKTNRSSIYNKYTSTLMEMTQVPEMYRDDLTKVVSGAMTGRYGEKGSQAVFQMITEQNPEFKADKLYENIQNQIKSGREEIQLSERGQEDRLRTYRDMLQRVPDSFVYAFLGFPKINLDDYKPIISGRVERAFETGRDEPMTLRPKAPSAPEQK